jgi:hypothetical protein
MEALASAPKRSAGRRLADLFQRGPAAGSPPRRTVNPAYARLTMTCLMFV